MQQRSPMPMKKHVSFSTRLVVDENGNMKVVKEIPADCTTYDDDTSKEEEEFDKPRIRFKRKRSRCWSKLETDLFYEVLGGTGTDFPLMNDYISDRTRLELKRKFQHEQKADSQRVSEVLSHPCMLDEELQQRVDLLLEKIPAEKDYMHSVARRKQAAWRRGAFRLRTEPSNETTEEGDPSEMASDRST